jgi:chromosomal replication initiation ATPase DnaA
MIDKIIQKTCRKWQVTYTDVLSSSREQELLFARMMIAKFLRQYTGYSLTKIGSLVNRNHSTITHYLKNWDSEFRFNWVFRNFAESLGRELEEDGKPLFTLEIEEEFNEIFGYDETEETQVWQ